MTNKADFAAAIVFFEEQLKDHLEQDREQAAQDDPDGMVHPIYMGKMVEPYYRSAIAALRAYPALAEEREQLRAESNGKNWQGIARIAALETENAALKDALDAARPLIEAAMGYKPEPFGHGREGLHEAAQDYQQKTSEKGEKP